MEDLYTIPPGVDLAHAELRGALAAIGIEQRSYVANGALNHSFTDHVRSRFPRRLFVVEGVCSKRPTEVVGDTTLWLLIRETARQVCAAPALASSATADGETVEQARYGEVTELVAA